MTLLICPFCDSGIAWNNCTCKYGVIAQRGGLIRARQLFFTDGSPKQETLKVLAKETIAAVNADGESRRRLVLAAKALPVPEPAAADDPRTPDPEATVPTRKRQGAKSDDGKGLRGEAKAGASGGAGNRRTTNRTARKRAPRGGATDVGPADRANGTGPSRKTSSVRQTKPKNGVTSPGEQRAPSRKRIPASDAPADPVVMPPKRLPRAATTTPTAGARRSLLAPKGECGFCDLRREADAARIHRHRGKPKPT